MVRPQSQQFFLGGRGGTTDLTALSGYKVREIVATLIKLDAGTSGQVGAESAIVKPFTFDQQVVHNDVANAAYLWQPPDAGATAHETMRSGAMTIAGTGLGIVAGNAGATRYAGQFGALDVNSSATIAGAYEYLEQAENAGQSWTFECWLYQAATAAAATVYYETNLAGGVFLQIALSTAGVLYVTHSGTPAWTAPAAIGAGGWHHIVLVYTAGAGTIQLYIDGASAGAATAYAPLGAWPGGQIVWNANRNGQIYTALGAVYANVAFAADDALRHYEDMTIDVRNGAYTQTGTNLIKGSAVTVVFRNAGGYGYDSVSQTIRAPLGPTNILYTNNGIFYVEATTLFEEE